MIAKSTTLSSPKTIYTLRTAVEYMKTLDTQPTNVRVSTSWTDIETNEKVVIGYTRLDRKKS